MTPRSATGAQVAAWLGIAILFGWFLALLAWITELSSEKRVSKVPVFASPVDRPDNRD